MIPLLATVTCALVIAGCGGSSRAPARPHSVTSRTSTASSRLTSQTSTQPSPEARFTAQANAICARVNTRLVSKTTNHSRRQLVRVIARNAVLERQGVAELAKLTPPESLASGWRRVLTYRRVLADELAKFATATKDTNRPALNALATSKRRNHAHLHEAATTNGPHACATLG